MKYVKERIEDPLNPNAVTALVTSAYNNADTELERYCSELADCSIDYGVRFWHDRLKTCCVSSIKFSVHPRLGFPASQAYV